MARPKSAKTLPTLRTALLAYYQKHKRDLPWRRSRDPYAIWVSEIMLQQTRVDTVLPRWQLFLDRFPSVRHLAAAREHEVCEAWAGLGYYRRARHLHRAARVVVEEHAGVLPRDVKSLLKLPGIGRYTAGAIASIAFDEVAPIVDGNVTRILARLFALPGTSDDTKLQRHVWALADELVQGEAPGDFNQAMMELGATVCLPALPRCLVCPLRAMCRAHREGDPARYPGAAKAAPKVSLLIAFAFIESSQGVWLRQRGLEGLWPGLWELPSKSGEGAKEQLEQDLGVALGYAAATFTHVLTHRRVTADVYRVKRAPALRDDITVTQTPLAAPLSALARKAIVAMAPKNSE